MLDDGIKYLHAMRKHTYILHKELGVGKCERCESLWMDMTTEQVEGQISVDILERLKAHIKSLHKALLITH
jgi:hypothetical protein